MIRHLVQEERDGKWLDGPLFPKLAMAVAYMEQNRANHWNLYRVVLSQRYVTFTIDEASAVAWPRLKETKDDG